MQSNQFISRRDMMRVLSGGALVLALGDWTHAQTPGARPPNIVHFVADDVGYDDVCCFGAKDVNTPNVDRLAKEGARLTSFYAPAPTCTPTRASLLTGRYSIRVKNCERVLFPTDQGGIADSNEITIAELLKKKDYATACIGKWHLGCQKQHLPLQHGFDMYFGIPYPNDHDNTRLNGTGSRGYKPVPLYEANDIIEQPTDLPNLPDRFVERAKKFMHDNKDKPFYLHYANIETHTPWYVPKRFYGTSHRERYGDAINCMDWELGQILDTIKELGLEGTTLVVFTSDNGPLIGKDQELENCYGPYAQVDPSRKHVLRGGKYQAKYEGGTRTPGIIKFPGKIPAGQIRDEIICGFDLYSTFADVAGVPVPNDRIIDGRSALPLLSNANGAKPLREYFFGINNKHVASVRWKNWVLTNPVKDEKAELYDISKDVSERTDVLSDHPDIVKQLRQSLDQAIANFKDEKAIQDQ